LTVSGAGQIAILKRALEAAVGGERVFDCVQATWNILEPSAGPVLAEARAAGVGVIVKEALANGRLTERNLDPAFAAKRQVLVDMAAPLGTTLDALSLAAALAQPWADVVLSGATTPEQLVSNLCAVDIKRDQVDTQLLDSLAESPEEYWGIRSKMAWN
jgi:aryl-alcohol dehydrogenase-like predicted oxidoreductase